MKRVINAIVRIEYEQDDNCYQADWSPADKDATAISLAMKPNFVTVESGIRLNSVHLHHATPYELVDWWALEHTPDHAYLKMIE